MKLGTMKVRCPDCGSDQFERPGDANLDTQVTCTQCGRAAVVRDLIDHGEAKRLATERVRKMLGKALKR